MSTIIYYFTGTGNSLFAAKKIAAKTQAPLVTATSAIREDIIDIEADCVGFVFPVQDFKPPKIIRELIEKLRSLEGKYVFALCTAGLTPGKTLKVFEKLIEKQGGKLSAGFALLMPHNGIGSGLFSLSEHEKMLMAATEKLEKISGYIAERKTGTVETTGLFSALVLSGMCFKMVPILFRLFAQVLKHGWESLGFHADDSCSGCGICEKICPVRNIILSSGKPVWSDYCVGCFACVHWCPSASIQLGTADMSIRLYHHPEISLEEMLP